MIKSNNLATKFLGKFTLSTGSPPPSATRIIFMKVARHAFICPTYQCENPLTPFTSIMESRPQTEYGSRAVHGVYLSGPQSGVWYFYIYASTVCIYLQMREIHACKSTSSQVLTLPLAWPLFPYIPLPLGGAARKAKEKGGKGKILSSH